MGIAMKDKKVPYTALVAAASISLIGVFVSSAVAYLYTGIIFGLLIVVGIIYGGFAGCIHSLPIRPWFILTTLHAGTWLQVKKKQVDSLLSCYSLLIPIVEMSLRLLVDMLH